MALSGYEEALAAALLENEPALLAGVRGREDLTLSQLESPPKRTASGSGMMEEEDPESLYSSYYNKYSQFKAMPGTRRYKRKSSSRRAPRRRYTGRKLSAAAAHVARLADIKVKRARFDQELAALSGIVKDDPLQQSAAARTVIDDRMSASMGGRVSGRGRYTFGSFLRQLESTGKRFLSKGGGMDTILGAATRAKGAIQGMGRYGGMGEYHDNQLIQGGAQSADIIGNMDEGDSIVLRDEEFVMNVYAPNIPAGTSSGFAAVTLEFNPGLANLTRKLSAYARHYQEYELGQLVFRLEPMVEESNVNQGITGSFSMAWEYDPNEPEPDNEDDMNAIFGVCIGHKLSNGLRLGVECDPHKVNKTAYRIRSHPVPYGRDVDEYDHGKLIIASNNIPSTFSNLAIAKLHVYYTLQLRKFKPDHTIQRDIFTISKNATGTIMQTPQQQFNEGSVLLAQQSNLGCKLSAGTNAGEWKITFPPTWSGCAQIDLRVEATGLGIGPATKAVTGNVNYIADFTSANPAGDAPSDEAWLTMGTTLATYSVRVRVRSATGSVENTVYLDLNPSAGTLTNWTVDIIEYSPQFFQSRLNPLPIFTNVSTGVVETIV
jgi:hypothetical protein